MHSVGQVFHLLQIAGVKLGDFPVCGGPEIKVRFKMFIFGCSARSE